VNTAKIASLARIEIFERLLRGFVLSGKEAGKVFGRILV
jgi:hypothetical protein